MIDKKKQITFLILILIVVFVLENFNYFRYPIYISRYATSNIIFDYLKQYGHLPASKLKFDDFYQPIIIISYLITYLIKIFSDLFISGFLLAYSFPILVFLLTYKVSEIYGINERSKNYISLINAIIASISTHILDMSNDLLIYFIILFLIYIHIEDNFTFSKKFYIITIFSSFFIPFYYYSGQVVFTLFIFIFYLYYLIISPRTKKSFSLFSFLSCLNFWLMFLVYGIFAGVGFISTFQNVISRIFLIPAEWLFFYLSIIVFLIHILLQKKFKIIFSKIRKFVLKTIKLWIVIFGILSIAIFAFIFLNFEASLKSESPLLGEFNFPTPYYHPISRSLNLINIIIIIVPFILFISSIIRKFYNNVKLNEIDLLYLVSLLLIIVFFPIFYIYGGLNMILIRSLRMIIVFAIIFPGFFFLNPKSFLKYLRNPTELNVKNIKFNEVDFKSSKRPKFHLNIDSKKRLINELIIILIIQTGLQFLLIYILNYEGIFFDVIKITILNVNFFFFPGYIFLKLFNLSNDNMIENYIYSIFISFSIIILVLILLNFISMIFIHLLLLIPYFVFSIITFPALLIQNFRNSKNKSKFLTN